MTRPKFAAGTVIDYIVDDSFGTVWSASSPSNGDRFNFAEMEYDSTTSQYYDRARSYDEAIGRFMSLDPLSFAAGDPDLYRYVGNGVTGVTDPTGESEAYAAALAAYHVNWVACAEGAAMDLYAAAATAAETAQAAFSAMMTASAAAYGVIPLETAYAERTCHISSISLTVSIIN